MVLFPGEYVAGAAERGRASACTRTFAVGEVERPASAAAVRRAHHPPRPHDVGQPGRARRTAGGGGARLGRVGRPSASLHLHARYDGAGLRGPLGIAGPANPGSDRPASRRSPGPRCRGPMESASAAPTICVEVHVLCGLGQLLAAVIALIRGADCCR